MPQRRGLSNLSVNIPSRREYSPTTKGRLHSRLLAGQSSSQIAKLKGVPKLIIDHLLIYAKQRNTTNNLPQSG